MRLLLIEDHHDVASSTGEFLTEQGHVVDYAMDGRTGLRLARQNEYDVIVLDLGLPGLDGLVLCRELRRDLGSTVPVLMLTARDSEVDIVAGFAAGADDYLTKPFSLRLLAVRLDALHRRRTGTVRRRLVLGDLQLDLETGTVRRGGRSLSVTPSGLRILERLMVASPALVTRAELEHLLWGDQPPDGGGALRMHIHALRAAIDGDEPHKLLHTRHGQGYWLGEAG